MKLRTALPSKVGVSKTIRGLDGRIVFTGTTAQWRDWVKERRRRGELRTPSNQPKIQEPRRLKPKFRTQMGRVE